MSVLSGAAGAGPLTGRRVFAFWAPLAATWLMMAAEGPFVAAVIARLPEPTFNLAAYGVAFALAMIVESPIIMIMSAATALVHDRKSFLDLRRFTYALNGAITVVGAVGLIPPLFRFVTDRLIGLPPEVAHLTHVAAAVLLPWPAAIGYRRLFHGVLIRHNLTRRVAYGTVVRLTTMAATGLGLYVWGHLPGVVVGAAALSAGVVAEAAASRVMAARTVARLLHGDLAGSPDAPGLPMGTILRFYLPLALTSMLTLGVNPAVTFFLGHSRMALESLAVLPVVTSLAFLFRSAAFAFQEVGIALLGRDLTGYRPLARFAAVLAACSGGALVLVAWTPAAAYWFATVSGLSPDLVAFARWPLVLLAVMPALEVLLSLQRAILVTVRRTPLITWATAIEVGGIVVTLAIGIAVADLIGAVAATLGILLGRVGANLFLLRPTFAAVRQRD